MKSDIVFYDMIKNYPNVKSNVVDWQPSGKSSAIITMRNGHKYKYNMYSKEFMRIFNCDEDGFPEDEEWKKSFAVSLVNQLIIKGVTQKELAARTGISNGMITNYCLGYSIPSVYNLSKIIRVLKCKYEDLVDFEL